MSEIERHKEKNTCPCLFGDECCECGDVIEDEDEIKPVENPYNAEIEGDLTLHRICDVCRAGLEADI